MCSDKRRHHMNNPQKHQMRWILSHEPWVRNPIQKESALIIWNSNHLTDHHLHRKPPQATTSHLVIMILRRHVVHDIADLRGHGNGRDVGWRPEGALRSNSIVGEVAVVGWFWSVNILYPNWCYIPGKKKRSVSQGSLWFTMCKYV